MSDVQGVNTAKVQAGTSQGNWVGQGRIKTGEKIWTDEYEAAALAAGQTIGIADLEDGAIIHSIEIVHDDLIGGGATLECGDSDTSDRYIPATVVAGAAGKIVLDEQAIDALQYQIGTNSGDNEIILTVAVAAITGTIRTIVKYTNG